MARKRVPGIYYIREAIKAKNKNSENKKYVMKHKPIEKKDRNTDNDLAKTNENLNSNYFGNTHMENVIKENSTEEAYKKSKIYISEPEKYRSTFGFNHINKQKIKIFDGTRFSEKYIGLIALGVIILLKSRNNNFNVR